MSDEQRSSPRSGQARPGASVRATVPATVRACGMGLFLIAALAAACVEPSAQLCEGGRTLCPSHLRCNELGNACVPPAYTACGNSRLDPGEACDEGDIDPGGNCSADCRSNNSCGNGIVDPRGGEDSAEQCDCGAGQEEVLLDAVCNGQANSDITGYCKADCTLHCGDGQLNITEACDGENLGDKSCVDFGFHTGVLGCSTGCSYVMSGCGRIGWYFEAVPDPMPAIRAVWGSSADSVFAVGDGAMAHYDGEAWTLISSEIDADLVDVWGTGDQNVFAVGSRGTIVRYDGSRVVEESSGGNDSMVAVWGAGTTPVFALSESGVVLRRRVTTNMETGEEPEIAWEQVVRLPDQSGRDLWGLSANQVFALGGDGTIFRYQGGNSAAVSLSDGRDYTALWGVGDTLYAVGRDGAFRQYQAGEWLPPVAPLTSVDLHGVWGHEMSLPGGESHAVVFIAGDDGTIFRYDGQRWQQMNTVPFDLGPNQHRPERFVSGWSGTLANVFAVEANEGGSRSGVWRYTGTDWGEEVVLASSWVTSLWGTGSDHVYAAADNGSVLHYDGLSWSVMASFGGVSLAGLWGPGEGDIVAVGREGAVFAYDHASKMWTDLRPRLEAAQVWEGGEPADLYRVWGDIDSDIFVAGASGTILRYRRATDEWGRMQLPADTSADITAIWGRADDDVFAVSADGRAYFYDGNPDDLWQLIWLNGLNPSWLNDLFGNDDEVYAVGGTTRDGAQRTTILRYAQGEWMPESELQTAADLHGVWSSRPGDAYAVGSEGTILHYDGRTWSPVESATARTLTAVWGAPDAVIFANDDGTLLTLRQVMGQ